MATLELEELYLGVPDDSVNLTFQDLAQVKQKPKPGNKNSTPTMMEAVEDISSPSPIKKLPSLDFNRSLQASSKPNQNLHHHLHGHDHNHDRHHYGHHHHQYRNSNHAVESSIRAFDDISISGMSMASNFTERGGRRRPGIPHSNICTICTTYIYIFRHRCLVCGRVYCRNCVALGMGDMTEGRKCLDCLGRRFGQRYINKAGKIWCWSRYPSMVKQAELKWAEKGPRRSGERAYGGGRSSVVRMSRSRSPMGPTRPHRGTSTPPLSFVTPCSPYSPHTSLSPHHLPL